MPPYHNYHRGRSGYRGRSRGRGRGGYGSRYYDADPQMDDRLSEIYEALGSLAQKLKELQPTNDGTHTDSERTSVHSRLGAVPSTANTTRDRPWSENPDFKRKVWDTSQLVRLDYHSKNWEDCPNSIHKAVDEVVDRIRPPCPSVDVQTRLQQAGEDFKTAICIAVKAHLHHQFEMKINNLTRYDPTDQNLVDQTAHRMIKRLHGRKISDDMIAESLAKIKHRVGHICDTNDHRDECDPKRPPRPKNKVVQTDERGNIPESNKRGHASDSSDLRDVEGDDSPAVPAPPDKRIGLESRSSNDTISNLAELNAQASEIEKFTCMRTRPFQINQVHDQTKTLMIMDSNGNAFKELDIPNSMQVFEFAGAKLSDVPSILMKSEHTLAKIDTIVIGIGTNNRNDSNTSQATQNMKDVLNWCNNKNKRLLWLDIPEFGGISRDAMDNIRTLNKNAKEVFQGNFIQSLDPWEIKILPNDRDNIHYTSETARTIMYALLCHLN